MLTFEAFVVLAALAGWISASDGEKVEVSNLGAFQSDWPVGDPRRCQEQSRLSKFDMKRFEVLPGIGWDNLRNLEAGQVVIYNYTQCKVTDDGNFLIPDNVFTVPIKASRVERFAELIDHWHNTSSVTSDTINIESGLSLSHFSISGKFSYEHQELKSKQIEDKAVTIRVQMRYLRYEAKLQPDPILSPQFKSRLMSIAAHVELNQTEMARYEAQLLVRDFGTHVLTSVTAGAGLVKDDYLKSEFVLDHMEKKSDILASASASFLSIFHFSASYGHHTDNTVNDMYNKSMTHSIVKTFGGPLFKDENMSLDQWTNGVDKNLVPMDRSGDPLYFLVTPHTLPELPPTTVAEVEKIVRQSIELYYEMNTIRGCTKMGSPNFSFSANFDDGSCDAKPTNLTFGGVYQTCSVSGSYLTQNPCNGLEQVNPKTGRLSCPPSYTSVLLHSAVKTGATETRTHCHSCWLFFHCCNTDQYHADAMYSTYWCAATGHVEKESGYLFGGIFTPNQDNPVTGTVGCPQNFYPRRIFFDVTVCISDDYEMNSGLSVPFGGFFSCDSGNPLASEGVHPVGLKLQAKPKNSLKSFMEQQNGAGGSYPMRCPEGYSQHMATVDVGCSIHYCVLTGALSGPNLPPVKRPPFLIKPPTLLDHENSMVMFNTETQTWIKNEKAVQFQQTLKAANVPTQEMYSTGQNKAGMSAGTAAGISVGATLAAVIMATIILVLIQRRRSSRRNGVYRRLTSETNYGSVADTSDTPDNVVVNN